MDALFERLPLVYVAAVVLAVLLPTGRARALGGIGLCLIALAAAGNMVGGPGGGSEFTTINEGLAVLGIAGVLAALLPGVRSRLPGAAAPRGSEPATAGGPDGLDAVLLAGAVLAAVGPHLLLVALGALVALAGAVRLAIRARRPVWLVPLLVAGALLGTGLALAFTILGPLGGALDVLAAGPFSPAAERLLVMLMGSAILLTAGLPPLDRAPYGLGLAPLGAVLLVRLLAPVFPGGLAEWEPLAMLVLVGSLGYSAFAQRWAAAAAAAGLLTLWSGQRNGIVAGLTLVGWGWLAQAVGQNLVRRGIRLEDRWKGPTALIPALAAFPALNAVLREQVVLSVLSVLAVAIGLGRLVLRRAPSQAGPLY